MPKLAIIGILLLAATLAAQTSPNKAPAARVEITNLRFDDTIGLTDGIEQEIAARVRTHSFHQNRYMGELEEVVHDLLQQHGYFKATVEQHGFKNISQNRDRTILEAAVIVYPGNLYRLDSIEFSGNTVFSAAQLRPCFSIADGEVFNIEKARSSIKRLKDAYGAKGFINFTPVPDFTFNEDAKTLKMKIDIDEGFAYRVGDLFIDGEESEPGAKQRLLAAWNKYKGQYRGDAIEQVFRDLHARADVPIDQLVRIEQDNVNHVLTYHLTLGKPHHAVAP